MRDIPRNQHITYQLQYRKCGKVSCSTCRDGQGHGPYWYAYWREGSRLRSGYVGKVHPNHHQLSTSPSENEAVVAAGLESPCLLTIRAGSPISESRMG